jgi:carbon monoxide dehydrogenase subunit G
MTTLRHQVRIQARAEDVWKALADLLAVQHYNPMVRSVRYISDRREGVGATRRCELEPKGWVEERVWDWSPNREIGFEVAASEWPLVFMKWKTELQQDGAATLVSQEMNYKMKFGPLGAIMDALIMRRKLDKGVQEIFQNLKRYVEAR